MNEPTIHVFTDGWSKDWTNHCHLSWRGLQPLVIKTDRPAIGKQRSVCSTRCWCGFWRIAPVYINATVSYSNHKAIPACKSSCVRHWMIFFSQRTGNRATPASIFQKCLYLRHWNGIINVLKDTFLAKWYNVYGYGLHVCKYITYFTVDTLLWEVHWYFRHSTLTGRQISSFEKHFS